MCHAEVHEHDTRYKKNLVPAYCRLRKCQDGPGYLAIKFFNVLPLSIRNLPETSFKNRIKQILIREAFYTFDEFINYKF